MKDQVKLLNYSDPAQLFQLFQSMINTGAGMHLLLKTDYNVLFASDQFFNVFHFNRDVVLNGDFNFLKIFDKYQAERFLDQASYTLKSNEVADNYVFYKLSDAYNSIRGAYIYLSVLKINPTDSFLNVLVLPDLFYFNSPFISNDTGNFFIEQVQNEGLGTLEWLIATDRVFCSEGIYDIFEISHDITNINIGFFIKFIHSDDITLWETTLVDLRKGNDANIVLRILSANNKLKYINAVLKWVDTKNSNSGKIIAGFRDITKTKKTEANLKKHVDELNRSNRELEEFAYIASHDMQEPLRKISTFSERLSDKYADLLSGDGLLCLQRIMASAENMRVLINDLLEFSRITKSTQPFTEVNLNFILQQVKNELELIIDESGTQIQNTDLPMVHASVQQLKQLFANLISNSIKFRKAYIHPIILIEAIRLNPKEKLMYNLIPDADYIKIVFTDNGIGFDNTYSERIFQIFQRLHGKSEYPGSGIGLAICKKIVEHHKGAIFAENIPGCGARFSVILPA